MISSLHPHFGDQRHHAIPNHSEPAVRPSDRLDRGGMDDFTVDLTERHIVAFEAAVAGLRERDGPSSRTSLDEEVLPSLSLRGMIGGIF